MKFECFSFRSSYCAKLITPYCRFNDPYAEERGGLCSFGWRSLPFLSLRVTSDVRGVIIRGTNPWSKTDECVYYSEFNLV